MDEKENMENQKAKKGKWAKKATGAALTVAVILAIWKLPAKWSEDLLKNI